MLSYRKKYDFTLSFRWQGEKMLLCTLGVPDHTWQLSGSVSLSAGSRVITSLFTPTKLVAMEM